LRWGRGYAATAAYRGPGNFICRAGRVGRPAGHAHDRRQASGPWPRRDRGAGLGAGHRGAHRVRRGRGSVRRPCGMGCRRHRRVAQATVLPSWQRDVRDLA
jgi:hypothetical protein